MSQSPRQAELQLRQGEFPDQGIRSQRHEDTKAAKGNQSQYLHDARRTPQASGISHAYQDFAYRGFGNANDFSQYRVPYINFDAERSALHNQQTSEPVSPFVLLRGIENCAVETNPGIQSRDLNGGETALPQETSPACKTSRRSESTARGSPALVSMQSLPPFPRDHGAAEGTPVSIRQTRYAPFQYRFADSVAARDHRRLGTRFGRLPYIDPGSDFSIMDIEHHRNLHVERIYNAMTSGEAAKDNRGSIAMKRWVIEAHYPPDLVEAYAHKVFDCLLAQAKDGFRGWVHNDYVADERKGEDIDKDVDCAGRLDNIILALEQEKTICEDVMNSACQIRMFVNAPRAYANRKHQNRVGNSKRGRTKDIADSNSKPAKAQRTGSRRARTRSATTSDMPSSRGTTQQDQQPTQYVPQSMPYFTPMLQHLPPSPLNLNNSASRLTPLHRPTFPAARSSFGQHMATVMSPPPASSPRIPHAPQSHIPQMAAVPLYQQSLVMSSPQTSYSHYSAPATPGEATPLATNVALNDWHDAGNLGALSFTAYQQSRLAVDPMLSLWNHPESKPCEVGRGSNLFDQPSSGFVNLSDIESPQSPHVESGSNQGSFEELWGAGHSFQALPHNVGSSKR